MGVALDLFDPDQFFGMYAPEKISLSELSRGKLEALAERLLAENAALKEAIAELRTEVAALKGLKGRARVKPSGMDKDTEPEPAGGKRSERSARGSKSERLAVGKERIIKAEVPPGSRFKGYEDFLVQNLVLRPRVVRLRRERWLTLNGRTVVAPMPAGIVGHFGPELRRFVLFQSHQGQVTVPRLVAQLRAIGITISKRQVVRLLNAGQDIFLEEARDVLRAGLTSAPWISVDDTGARHKHQNGICTQLGNDHFAAFVTTASKSRLNFLEVLRAGFAEYVINAEALAYMRQRALAGPVITRLDAHPERHFEDASAWTRHLERLGITALKVTPDPVRIATEGALWDSIKSHGLLPDTAVLSDDAGQFAIDRHALCWVHAERLVHKLGYLHRPAARRPAVPARPDLVVLRRPQGLPPRAGPAPARGAAGEGSTASFAGRTGLTRRVRVAHATLDRLLARLHANKKELLAVLDRPEIPLHTCAQRTLSVYGSERDLRPQVIKRKISGGTRSDAGRDCRDAFLGLLLTCQKIGISFWEYLGHRLGLPGAEAPDLPELVSLRSAPA